MSEIMTLYESRKALSTVHNLELPYHGSFITPEQAEAINEKFVIEIHAGVHGKTEKDYDAAKNVVTGMKPHDVLFVEGFGFSFNLEASLVPRDYPKILEQDRQEKQIDAFGYAWELAYIKGIRILIADLDKFDENNFKELTGDPDWRLGGKKTELDLRIHRLREQRARNIIKDYAVDNLEHKGSSLETKPKLILMFGRAHKEDLHEAFRELGLNVKVFDMKESTPEEQTANIISRLGRVATQVLQFKQSGRSSLMRKSQRQSSDSAPGRYLKNKNSKEK